jgi:hypothetical protein
MSLADFTKDQLNAIRKAGFVMEHTDVGPVGMFNMNDGSYKCVYVRELVPDIYIEFTGPDGSAGRGLPIDIAPSDLFDALITLDEDGRAARNSQWVQAWRDR